MKISLKEITDLRKKLNLSYNTNSTELVKEAILNKKGKIVGLWVYNKPEDIFFVECEKNHVFKTSWGHIQRGSWCPICRPIKKENRKRLDGNKIREFIKNKKGRLDENWKYINTQKKFNVTCQKGHKWITTWNRIYRDNSWCEECHRLNKEKEVIEFVTYKKGRIADNNWKYINNQTKFKIICSQGHFTQTNWVNMKSCFCSECAEKRRKLKKEEKVINTILKKEGALFDPWKYTGTNNKFKIICNKGHIFNTSWNILNYGSWCPECQKFKKETAFRNVIETFFEKKFPTTRPEWLNRDWKRKKAGKGLELDGYNEDLRIGFEFQGVQHYKEVSFFNSCGERFEAVKKRDHFKKEKCKENGVLLICVPYWLTPNEWENLIIDNILVC